MKEYTLNLVPSYPFSLEFSTMKFVCFELTFLGMPLLYYTLGPSVVHHKRGTILFKVREFNLTLLKEITLPDDGNSFTINPLLLYPFLTSVISFITELQTSSGVFLS